MLSTCTRAAFLAAFLVLSPGAQAQQAETPPTVQQALPAAVGDLARVAVLLSGNDDPSVAESVGDLVPGSAPLDLLYMAEEVRQMLDRQGASLDDRCKALAGRPLDVLKDSECLSDVIARDRLYWRRAAELARKLHSTARTEFSSELAELDPAKGDASEELQAWWRNSAMGALDAVALVGREWMATQGEDRDPTEAERIVAALDRVLSEPAILALANLPDRFALPAELEVIVAQSQPAATRLDAAARFAAAHQAEISGRMEDLLPVFCDRLEEDGPALSEMTPPLSKEDCPALATLIEDVLTDGGQAAEGGLTAIDHIVERFDERILAIRLLVAKGNAAGDAGSCLDAVTAMARAQTASQDSLSNALIKNSAGGMATAFGLCLAEPSADDAEDRTKWEAVARQLETVSAPPDDPEIAVLRIMCGLGTDSLLVSLVPRLRVDDLLKQSFANLSVDSKLFCTALSQLPSGIGKEVADNLLAKALHQAIAKAAKEGAPDEATVQGAIAGLREALRNGLPTPVEMARMAQTLHLLSALPPRFSLAAEGEDSFCGPDESRAFSLGFEIRIAGHRTKGTGQETRLAIEVSAVLLGCATKVAAEKRQRMMLPIATLDARTFDLPLIAGDEAANPEQQFKTILDWARGGVTDPRIAINQGAVKSLLQFLGADPAIVSLLFDRKFNAEGKAGSLSVELTASGQVQVKADVTIADKLLPVCLRLPETDANGDCLPGRPDKLPEHLQEKLVPILLDDILKSLPTDAGGEVGLEWRQAGPRDALVIRVLAQPLKDEGWEKFPRFVTPPELEWNLATGDVKLRKPELDWRPVVEAVFEKLPKDWVQLTEAGEGGQVQCAGAFQGGSAAFHVRLGGTAPIQGPLGTLCLNTSDPSKVRFFPEAAGQLSTADGGWTFRHRFGSKDQSADPDDKLTVLTLSLEARGKDALFGSVRSKVALRLDLESGAWSFPADLEENRELYAAIQEQVSRFSPRGVVVHSIAISSKGVTFSVDPSGAIKEGTEWLLSELPEIDPETWKDAAATALKICGEGEQAYSLAKMLQSGKRPDQGLCRTDEDPLKSSLKLPGEREVAWLCEPVKGDPDLLSICRVRLPLAAQTCGEELQFEVTWTDQEGGQSRQPEVKSKEISDCAKRLWENHVGGYLPAQIRPQLPKSFDFAAECATEPAACAIGAQLSVPTSELLELIGKAAQADLPKTCGQLVGGGGNAISATVFISLDGSTRFEFPGAASRDALQECLKDIAIEQAAKQVLEFSGVAQVEIENAINTVGTTLQSIAEGFGATCGLVPADQGALVRSCDQLVAADFTEARLAGIELAKDLQFLGTQVQLVYVLPLDGLDALIRSPDDDDLKDWVAQPRSVELHCAGQANRACIETLVEDLAKSATSAVSTSWIEFGVPDITLTRDRMELILPVHASIDILNVAETVPLTCTLELSMDNPAAGCNADLQPEAWILGELAKALNERLKGRNLDLGLLSVSDFEVKAEGSDALVVKGTASLPAFPKDAVDLTISLKTNGAIDVKVDANALLAKVEDQIADQMTGFLDGIAPIKITNPTFVPEDGLPEGLRLEGEIDVAGLFRISSPAVILDRHGFRVDGPSAFTIGFETGVPILVGPIAICPTGGTIAEEMLIIDADVTLGECETAGAILALKGQIGVALDPLVLSANGSLRVLSLLNVGEASARLELSGPSLKLAADLGGDLSDVLRIKANVDIVPPKLDAVGDISVFNTSIGDGSVHIDMKEQHITAQTQFDLGYAAGNGSFVTGPGFSRPTALASAQYQIGGFPILGGDLKARMRYARIGVRFMGLNLGVAFPGLDVVDPSRLGDLLKDLLKIDFKNFDKALEALLSGNVTINPFADFGSGGEGLGGDGDSDAAGPAGDAVTGTGEDGQAEAGAAEPGEPAAAQDALVGEDAGLIGTEQAQIAYRREDETVVIARADGDGALFARAALDDAHFVTEGETIRPKGAVLAVAPGYFSQLVQHKTLTTGIDGCPAEGPVVHLYGGEVVTTEPNRPAPEAVARGYYELCRLTGPNGQRLDTEAVKKFDSDGRRDLAALNHALVLEMLYRPGKGTGGPRDQGLLFQTGRMVETTLMRGSAVELRPGQVMIVARARIEQESEAACGSAVPLAENADWAGPRAFLVSGLSLGADTTDDRLQAVVAAMWECDPGTRARVSPLEQGEFLAAGPTLSEKKDGAYAAVTEVLRAQDTLAAPASWLGEFDTAQDRLPPQLLQADPQELANHISASDVATVCVGDGCEIATNGYSVEAKDRLCSIRYDGVAAGQFPVGRFAEGCGIGDWTIVATEWGNTLLVGPPNGELSDYVIATADGLLSLTPPLPAIGNRELPLATLLAVQRELIELLGLDGLTAGERQIDVSKLEGHNVFALYNGDLNQGDPNRESWSVGWEGQVYEVDVFETPDIQDGGDFVALMSPGTLALTLLPDGYLLRSASDGHHLYRRENAAWGRLGRVTGNKIEEVRSLVTQASLPVLQPGEERELIVLELDGHLALAIRNGAGGEIRFLKEKPQTEQVTGDQQLAEGVKELSVEWIAEPLNLSAGSSFLFSIPASNAQYTTIYVYPWTLAIEICVFDEQFNTAGWQDSAQDAKWAMVPPNEDDERYLVQVLARDDLYDAEVWWFLEQSIFGEFYGEFVPPAPSPFCQDRTATPEAREDLRELFFGTSVMVVPPANGEIEERAASMIEPGHLPKEDLEAIAAHLFAKANPVETEIFRVDDKPFLAEGPQDDKTAILRREGTAFTTQTTVIHEDQRPETDILKDIARLAPPQHEVTLQPLDIGEGLSATAMTLETGLTTVWVRRDGRLHRLQIGLPGTIGMDDTLLQMAVAHMIAEDRDQVEIVSLSPLALLSGSGTCRPGRGQTCLWELVVLNESTTRLSLLLSNRLSGAMLDYLRQNTVDLPTGGLPIEVLGNAEGNRSILQISPDHPAFLVEQTSGQGDKALCLGGNGTQFSPSTLRRLMEKVPADLLPDAVNGAACDNRWSVEAHNEPDPLIWQHKGSRLSVLWMADGELLFHETDIPADNLGQVLGPHASALNRLRKEAATNPLPKGALHRLDSGLLASATGTDGREVWVIGHLTQQEFCRIGPVTFAPSEEFPMEEKRKEIANLLIGRFGSCTGPSQLELNLSLAPSGAVLLWQQTRAGATPEGGSTPEATPAPPDSDKTRLEQDPVIRIAQLGGPDMAFLHLARAEAVTAPDYGTFTSFAGAADITFRIDERFLGGLDDPKISALLGLAFQALQQVSDGQGRSSQSTLTFDCLPSSDSCSAIRTSVSPDQSIGVAIGMTGDPKLSLFHHEGNPIKDLDALLGASGGLDCLFPNPATVASVPEFDLRSSAEGFLVARRDSGAVHSSQNGNCASLGDLNTYAQMGDDLWQAVLTSLANDPQRFSFAMETGGTPNIAAVLGRQQADHVIWQTYGAAGAGRGDIIGDNGPLTPEQAKAILTLANALQGKLGTIRVFGAGSPFFGVFFSGELPTQIKILSVFAWTDASAAADFQSLRDSCATRSTILDNHGTAILSLESIESLKQVFFEGCGTDLLTLRTAQRKDLSLAASDSGGIVLDHPERDTVEAAVVTALIEGKVREALVIHGEDGAVFAHATRSTVTAASLLKAPDPSSGLTDLGQLSRKSGGISSELLARLFSALPDGSKVRQFRLSSAGEAILLLEGETAESPERGWITANDPSQVVSLSLKNWSGEISPDLAEDLMKFAAISGTTKVEVLGDKEQPVLLAVSAEGHYTHLGIGPDFMALILETPLDRARRNELVKLALAVQAEAVRPDKFLASDEGMLICGTVTVDGRHRAFALLSAQSDVFRLGRLGKDGDLCSLPSGLEHLGTIAGLIESPGLPPGAVPEVRSDGGKWTHLLLPVTAGRANLFALQDTDPPVCEGLPWGHPALGLMVDSLAQSGQTCKAVANSDDRIAAIDGNSIGFVASVDHARTVRVFAPSEPAQDMFLTAVAEALAVPADVQFIDKSCKKEFTAIPASGGLVIFDPCATIAQTTGNDPEILANWMFPDPGSVEKPEAEAFVKRVLPMLEVSAKGARVAPLTPSDGSADWWLISMPGSHGAERILLTGDTACTRLQAADDETAAWAVTQRSFSAVLDKHSTSEILLALGEENLGILGAVRLGENRSCEEWQATKPMVPEDIFLTSSAGWTEVTLATPEYFDLLVQAVETDVVKELLGLWPVPDSTAWVWHDPAMRWRFVLQRGDQVQLRLATSTACVQMTEEQVTDRLSGILKKGQTLPADWIASLMAETGGGPLWFSDLYRVDPRVALSAQDGTASCIGAVVN